MSIWQPKIFLKKNLFRLFSCGFLTIFFFDFDGYYIDRTDEGHPKPKYIFNKCGTNIYFFLLYRGLVHHHHRILKCYYIILSKSENIKIIKNIFYDVWKKCWQYQWKLPGYFCGSICFSVHCLQWKAYIFYILSCRNCFLKNIKYIVI